MTPTEIARAIRQASLALPTNHPVQSALDAAHEVLLNPSASPVVNAEMGEMRRPLGRESAR